jgi:hypothetical protein
MITLVDRLVEPEIAIDDDAETSSFPRTYPYDGNALPGGRLASQHDHLPVTSGALIVWGKLSTRTRQPLTDLGRQFSYGVGFDRFHFERSNKPITLIPLSGHSVTGHSRLVMTIKVDATSTAARVAGLLPSDGDRRTVSASRSMRPVTRVTVSQPG